MSEIARAIQVLELKVTEEPDDAEAHYRLGVLLLEDFSGTGKKALLGQARKHLARAIELRPKHARSHAATGYSHDVSGKFEQALACFQEARRLDVQDKVLEVYVLTLLADTERNEEALAGIEAAAPRHDVDLPALREELTRVRFPTDPPHLIMNGFIHARNYFRSSLGDEADRILNSLDPGRARKAAAAERKQCAEHQAELARAFDASRVPESLRALAPMASRFGVGDDHCRPFLMGRLSKKERVALIRDVDAHALAIQEWLDSFGGNSMTDEAAAMMYLALGVEEIRDPAT